MAIYGAKNQKWAKWADESPDADAKKLPKYDAAKTLGELNKVTDQYNFVDGSLAGDDVTVLYEKKFKDGSVKVSSVYISVKDNAEIHGSKSDAKDGMASSASDDPPYVGYGFTTMHKSRSNTYFQVVFFPKLKASPDGRTYDTRGENISFTTDDLSFHMEVPLCGVYRVIKDFATEAEAIAYLDTLFGGTAAVPGLSGE